ncbi:MAG: PH domain-containing protein [Haloarculaceae archaeon]
MSRLHPLTILIRGASRGIGFAVAASVVGNVLGTVAGPLAVAGSGVLAALGLLLGVGYEIARYRRYEYDLTDDTLDIRSGVFARREREIPLGRVQNVDVSRTLFGRLVGVATVAVETAGGGSTEAKLQYVGLDAARELQEGIRTRKRHLRRVTDDASAGAAVDREETQPQGTATKASERREMDQGEVLFELDADALLLVSLLSFDVRSLSALLFVVPLVAPLVGGYLDGIGLAVGPLFVALAVVGTLAVVAAFWLVSAARTFVQFYGFRLRRLGDELRYERGLLQRYDGSIPLEKVQTLTVEENLLMRRFGYAALSVETAGYAPGAAPQGGSEAAVPLAARDDVLALAADLEPFEPPSFERPPERARRRYAVRYGLVAVGLTAVAFAVNRLVVSLPWYLPVVLVALAPVAARATWRHRGRALGDEHVFTRNGFWRRRTHVVPYYRVQTVIERRTFFQRRWGLATVVVDTAGSQSLVGGDARAVDLDDADARTFARDVADRFQAALVRRRRGGDAGPDDGDGGDAGAD